MSGQAVLRSGAGMLKIATRRKENREMFACFPEAMLAVYDEETALEELVRENLDWADVIGIGPGIGISHLSERLLELLLKLVKKPLVIDADGLRLVKGKEALLRACKGPVILTPHLGKLQRLPVFP